MISSLLLNLKEIEVVCAHAVESLETIRISLLIKLCNLILHITTGNCYIIFGCCEIMVLILTVSTRLVPIYRWLRAKRAASSSVKQAVATGVESETKAALVGRICQ